MIFITAGHTGAQSGAMGVKIENGAHFDEGVETILLRNRVAEILTKKYGIMPLLDRDNEHLAVLVKRINDTVSENDICIDIHFNSALSSMAHGTEIILSDDATDAEIALGVRLLNNVAHTLGTMVREVKTERQTPLRRLAMLHLKCRCVILEICFCSNIGDMLKYQELREYVAETIADTIAHEVLINDKINKR